MSISFNIDIEKLQNLNGIRAEALFKYLKRVSKNNTPIVMHATKKENYWDCYIVECSIPTSIFSKIKLPAEKDQNPESTSFNLQLTSDLIDEFADGTDFTVKNTTIDIVRPGFKARCGRVGLSESLEEQLEDFLGMLNVDGVANTAKLYIQNSSETINILKNLKTAPDAAIFVNRNSVTLMKDTVFFRTKNLDKFEDNGAADIYINMYLANMITGFLDYSDLVTLEIKDNKTVITGYEGTEEVSENIIVRNISATYETDVSNPTDEDLEANFPNEVEANIVSLDMETFIQTLEKQKGSILTFSDAKNWQAKLFKNGNGLTLGFAKIDSPTEVNVTVSIGEIEKEDVEAEEFTEYSTILPLDLITNIFHDSLNLEIVYQNDEDTAVLFRIGDSKILSGKIY